MSDTNGTLAIISQGWQAYQNRLSEALAPLSLEQLALRAAPDLRSIDELARHVIAVRAGWFHDVLDEGGDDFGAFAQWHWPDSPPRPASELVSGLATTWQVMQEEFHVQTIGLSKEDAAANMAYTQERLVTPIEKDLDNPKTRKEASNKAIWFVRSTAQFFREYFEGRAAR